MPGEGVPAQPLAVARGPVRHPVTAGVVELVLVRLGGVELHLVLSGDHVELTVRDGRVGRVGKLAGAYRGAEVAAALRRGGAERGGGLGSRGEQNRAGCGEDGRDADGQRSFHAHGWITFS